MPMPLRWRILATSAAIDQFNGRELGGRSLKVNEAKAREERSDGRGAGGNRSGYRW